MGGITFFLFLVETVTGVLLMFLLPADAWEHALQRQSSPSANVGDARHPSANCTAGGAHADGDHDLAAHVPRLPDRQLQATQRIQLGSGASSSWC